MMRILLIPVFIVVYYAPFAHAHMAAALVFSLACLTDWLDGFLARKLHQISSFGAFLDPVADKLIVAASLLMLVGSGHLHYITLPAIIIVGREIVISALREWMAEIGKRASVAVSYVGKVKTTLQMLAIILLLAFSGSPSWWNIVGTVLLYASAVMTIWSMIAYLKIAWPELVRDEFKGDV